MHRVQLLGQHYGELHVIGFHGVSNARSLWLCRCRCGNKVVRSSHNLRSDGVMSCGCKVRKHGDWSHGRPTTEWKTWDGMRQRCGNKRCKDWLRYGGRGISVCSRWQTSFVNFLSDMGRKPGPSYSIDRIDNDGNYEPGNCRWATKSIQSANQCRRRLM